MKNSQESRSCLPSESSTNPQNLIALGIPFNVRLVCKLLFFTGKVFGLGIMYEYFIKDRNYLCGSSDGFPLGPAYTVCLI